MITITWGTEDKTVLKYEFEGSWSIDDLIEALDAGVEVTQRYAHDMDVVVDLTRSGLPNLFGMNVNTAFKRAFNRTEQHIEDNGSESGLIVVVSSNPIIRNSLTSMMKMYQRMGERIAVANTLDEAYSHIAAFRRQTAKTA